MTPVMEWVRMSAGYWARRPGETGRVVMNTRETALRVAGATSGLIY